MLYQSSIYINKVSTSAQQNLCDKNLAIRAIAKLGKNHALRKHCICNIQVYQQKLINSLSQSTVCRGRVSPKSVVVTNTVSLITLLFWE